ncbi:Putative reactive intermediate deaminase TdcF [Planctomycetes bacterium Poly30]|uniref:Reactive intermediate deaminase TdcF n=1 Tax=Saltatorellus ferox TaxID=2528018 RepID=A0A518F0X4_9BACT|nr:Putative reactive intermediate deaminase TdcF [Planctomycetes bacterium Poly30]
MQIPQHPSIPTPAGHYSPIVEHAGTLYVSGQLPIHPETKVTPEGIESQVLQALENVERLLQAAGTDRASLVQVRIYVTDVSFWPLVNEVYARFMGEHRPARIVVPCGSLNHGCLVEIEAVAATGTST